MTSKGPQGEAVDYKTPAPPPGPRNMEVEDRKAGLQENGDSRNSQCSRTPRRESKGSLQNPGWRGFHRCGPPQKVVENSASVPSPSAPSITPGTVCAFSLHVFFLHHLLAFRAPPPHTHTGSSSHPFLHLSSHPPWWSPPWTLPLPCPNPVGLSEQEPLHLHFSGHRLANGLLICSIVPCEANSISASQSSLPVDNVIDWRNSCHRPAACSLPCSLLVPPPLLFGPPPCAHRSSAPLPPA